jgi:acyl-coenzyme A synthetase/AMP-(fatty) acid ligase/3-hydroxymyristoyl/3-hydroxydecanoyl-(acyl carrier protein) dehydratase
MTRRSISGFFSDGRNAADIIAYSGSDVLSVTQFHRDVVRNAERLRTISCQRGVLAYADSYWAAVGILSLFHAGAAVAMLPSARLDGIGKFANPGDHIVVDRPIGQAESVLVLEPGTDTEVAPGDLASDNCVIDLFTSGSTAQPKLISKTLRQLECEAAIVEELFGANLPRLTRVQATVPHHHLYGLTFGLIWPLLAGRPFRREAHEVWETVFASNLANSVLVTSPAHLTRLAGFPQLRLEQRPALILSAGAALPVQAVHETEEILRRPPTEIFGSTETGAIAWRNWVDEAPLWSPLPGVKIGQQDDGRMLVTSPFITGDQPFIGADLIDLQPDQRFRALGRADDICKIEGKRISLSMIETHLLKIPGIIEAAAILLNEDRPRLGAVVKLDRDGKSELMTQGQFRFGQSLRRKLASQLDTASLPKRWRFVDQLPTRAMGKRRVADLQALFVGEASKKQRPAIDEPAIKAMRQGGEAAGSSHVELDLYISRDLPQLDGHFPDLPIVPGVALVDWAVRFTSRYLKLGDGVARALQVKFRRIVSPDTEVTLTLEHQASRHRLAFTYRQSEQILASGSFRVGSS